MSACVGFGHYLSIKSTIYRNNLIELQRHFLDYSCAAHNVGITASHAKHEHISGGVYDGYVGVEFACICAGRVR